jgi:hypothetical protein
LRSPTAAGWVGQGYAIGDFNQDGLPDFMLAREGNAPDAAYIHLRQDALGSFTQQREWSAFDSPQDLISADMNGDGKDDLLVVHGGWSSIGYQQQTWKGLDVEIKYYTVQSGNPASPAIAAGDLNGDGCKDVAMADYNYGLVVMTGKNCLTVMHDSRAPVPLLPFSGPAPSSIPARPSSAAPTSVLTRESWRLIAFVRQATSVPFNSLQAWRVIRPAAAFGLAGFGLLLALGWLAWLRFHKLR